jgi:hypothetical protein
MEMVSTKVEQAQHCKNVKKGHNGIPEFMSYDSIMDTVKKKTQPTKDIAEVDDDYADQTYGDGAPAPAKPKTRPETPTRTKPGKRPNFDPFKPGPGIDPRPKAGVRTLKNKKK